MNTVWKQGAEGRIYISQFYGVPCVIKERFKRKYRQPELDSHLTQQRIKAEARVIVKCKEIGLNAPTVLHVDLSRGLIYLQLISDAVTLAKSPLTSPTFDKVGSTLAKMHRNNIIHGDLTSSNILITFDGNVYLIDFGLAHVDSALTEDKAVDLYVFERSLRTSHRDTESLFSLMMDSYVKEWSGGQQVKDKLDEVRLRGRKREMVG